MMQSNAMTETAVRPARTIKLEVKPTRRASILMILHLPPPIHGAAVMGKYIKDSLLINGMFDIDYVNLSTSNNLREIGRGSLKKITSTLQVALKVAKCLFDKKYDLCYMTLTAASKGFYKDLIVVSILKLAGKRIIYHFHNQGVSSRQSRFIDNLLYRFAFRNTRSILVSPVLYSDIKKYVKRENIFVCPNGIQQGSGKVSAVHSTDEAPCRLLFLSHIMVEKGVFTLLEACRDLRDKGVRFVLHCVGSWTNITEQEFNSMVDEFGLQHYIKCHGPKFGEEKNEFLYQSDILVHPSYSETFGLVLLEAMSYGLPVVATSVGGIPDIVVDEQTGFLVEERNFEALSEKLQLLIRDKNLREKFGKAGAERYRSNFTIDKFEQNVSEILKASV